MWLIFALLSAFFSGTTAVLAKYGIKKVDSSLAVALRSVVILAFAWLTLLVTGGWADIGRAGATALLFPLISGITNALSWICYFKALSIGQVGSVASVDKAGIALTIVGGSLFLGEEMSIAKAVSIPLVIVGSALMAEHPPRETRANGDAVEETATEKRLSQRTLQSKQNSARLIWAIASALFTAVTTLFAKAGVQKLPSELGFAIRTGVMFIIAWSVAVFTKKTYTIDKISRKSMLFIGLSGLTTAIAWLFYFKALASPGAEASIVQPIDKLNIWVSIAGAWLFMKEKLTQRAIIGLLILTVGILVLLL